MIQGWELGYDDLGRPIEPDVPPIVPSCNRHKDCNAANAKRPDLAPYYTNYHCYDDDCEDCFGK